MSPHSTSSSTTTSTSHAQSKKSRITTTTKKSADVSPPQLTSTTATSAYNNGEIDESPHSGVEQKVKSDEKNQQNIGLSEGEEEEHDNNNANSVRKKQLEGDDFKLVFITSSSDSSKVNKSHTNCKIKAKTKHKV